MKIDAAHPLPGLKKAILADGRSVEQIAAASDIHFATMYAVMRGAENPDYRIAYRLASALKTTIDQLAGIKGKHPYLPLLNRDIHPVAALITEPRREFAARAGLSPAHLSQFLAGRKSLSAVKFLGVATTLNVSPHALAECILQWERQPPDARCPET